MNYIKYNFSHTFKCQSALFDKTIPTNDRYRYIVNAINFIVPPMPTHQQMVLAETKEISSHDLSFNFVFTHEKKIEH